MKLYHFTSTAHAKQIIIQGISECRIPWMMDRRTGRVGMYGRDDPHQWLTESPEWDQDWDEGFCPPMPPYRRTECRITVDFYGSAMTRLFKWENFARIHKPESAEFLNSFASSRHWFLFRGVIQPGRFVAVDRNPSPCIREPAPK